MQTMTSRPTVTMYRIKATWKHENHHTICCIGSPFYSEHEAETIAAELRKQSPANTYTVVKA